MDCIKTGVHIVDKMTKLLKNFKYMYIQQIQWPKLC